MECSNFDNCISDLVQIETFRYCDQITTNFENLNTFVPIFDTTLKKLLRSTFQIAKNLFNLYQIYEAKGKF